MPTLYKLPEGISAHAWSPDRKRIAVCHNDEKIIIYANADKGDFSKWTKEHILLSHDLVVCGLDWSPIHGKIVSCAHDRNAFVWTLSGQKWTPSLSILRINRAALDVKWSPDGKKFAVASGSKVVPVCVYESKNDWWIAKMIKKHRSTVTSVAWHPNSQLLATGCTDFKCRVFSTYNPQVDSPVSTPLGKSDKTAFGDLLVEFGSSSGWIQDCAWSPSGDSLAFVGHDSSVSFVTFAKGSPVCQTLKTKNLPNQVVMYLSDAIVVAGGHSFNPEIYSSSNGSWSYAGNLDKEASSSSPTKKAASNFSAARSIWANKTTRGQDNNAGSASLWTQHHNCITDIKPYSDSTLVKFEKFSTTGLDGRLVIWDKSDLKNAGVSL